MLQSWNNLKKGDYYTCRKAASKGGEYILIFDVLGAAQHEQRKLQSKQDVDYKQDGFGRGKGDAFRMSSRWRFLVVDVCYRLP